MNSFQKLEEPLLVELEGEFSFVTEIDLSLMKNGIILMRGESYNYKDGLVKKQKNKEIHYNVMENAYYDLDENGKILDYIIRY